MDYIIYFLYYINFFRKYFQHLFICYPLYLLPNSGVEECPGVKAPTPNSE